MGALGGLLLLALTGLVCWVGRPALAEVFDEACFELGKQWIYEAKDTLLCDRSGRRININKYCKAHLSSSTGRLIIDNSVDENPAEPKKNPGHFPELCLPGQRSHAVQAPFLCTCVMHKGRQRWECVVPEDGGGRGMGSDLPGGSAADGGVADVGGGENDNRVWRGKRSAGELAPPDALSSTALLADDMANASVAHAATARSPTLARVAAEPDDGVNVANANGTQPGGPSASGRQAAAPYRPSIVIDFCDEFGYVHTISSTVRECSCDKDVITTKMLSFKDNDIYHSSSLFSTYECLPGTYNLRCEVCYPETHTCQPVACS